jgi:hypothetical protein
LEVCCFQIQSGQSGGKEKISAPSRNRSSMSLVTELPNLILLWLCSESVNSYSNVNLLRDDVEDTKLAVMFRLLCSDFAHTVLHVREG